MEKWCKINNTKDIIKLSDYFNVPMDIFVGKDSWINHKSFNETDVLFDKYKDVLTESDNEIIKTIIK